MKWTFIFFHNFSIISRTVIPFILSILHDHQVYIRVFKSFHSSFLLPLIYQWIFLHSHHWFFLFISHVGDSLFLSSLLSTHEAKNCIQFFHPRFNSQGNFYMLRTFSLLHSLTHFLHVALHNATYLSTLPSFHTISIFHIFLLQSIPRSTLRSSLVRQRGKTQSGGAWWKGANPT